MQERRVGGNIGRKEGSRVGLAAANEKLSGALHSALGKSSPKSLNPFICNYKFK